VQLVEVCGTKVGAKNTDGSTGLATSDCVQNKNTQQAYLASLAFTGVPGFVMGILCLVLSILFCLCRCFCCICCGTNFCPTGTAEEGYSPMTLLVPKVCILGFSFLAIVGCGLGYFGLFALQDALNELVQVLLDAVAKMVSVVNNISTSLETAGTVLGTTISLGDLQKAAADIDKALKDSTGGLSGIFELVTTVGLGVGFFYFAMIIFGAVGSFLNINCILYIVLLLGVIVMFTAWIMFGIFFFTANFTSDICTVIVDYLRDPAGSTLGAFFPCLPVDVTTSTITTVRQTLTQLVDGVNTPLYAANVVNQNMIDQGVGSPVAGGVPYMCGLYEKTTVGAACNATLIAETIDSFDGASIVEAAKWDDSDVDAGREKRCGQPEYLDIPTNKTKNPAYTRCFVGDLGEQCGFDCGYYYLGMCSLLGRNKLQSSDPMYRARPSPWNDGTYSNDADGCPYSGPFTDPDTGNTVNVQFTMTYDNIAPLKPFACENDDPLTCATAGTPIIQTAYSTITKYAPVIGLLVGITEDLDYLMSCRFVYNAFKALNGALCESLLASASLLWTGFLFVGICFIPLTFLWLFAIAVFDKPLGYMGDAEGGEDPYDEADPEGKVVEETAVEPIEKNEGAP